MAKIPFDIKWKPQIESGEYKVETRSGKTARIVCWDRIGTPLVVLVGRSEDILTYKSNGTTGQQMQLPSDLFIVTPEEELSEFEKAVGLEIFDEPFGEEHIKVIKEESAKLFALARKELHENMKEALRTEYEKGRADALKDLPRWKKCEKPFDSPSNCGYNGENLIHHGYALSIDDAYTKLPKDE